MNLGRTIKAVRKDRKYTQEQFAFACGITQTYLSQIENNLKDPTLAVLRKIAEKLSLPLPILFFQSITEEDVQPAKRDIFNQIEPLVKNLVSDLFTI